MTEKKEAQPTVADLKLTAKETECLRGAMRLIAESTKQFPISEQSVFAQDLTLTNRFSANSLITQIAYDKYRACTKSLDR